MSVRILAALSCLLLLAAGGRDVGSGLPHAPILSRAPLPVAGTTEALPDLGHVRWERMQASPADTLSTYVRLLTRDAIWEQAAVVPVRFDVYHPQGFALVGDHLFLSSVEILEPTRRFDPPSDGFDRSTGRGRGHLFKLNLDGELVAHVELGEGDVYHPGGIDFDGTSIWVPVAEYRPHSRTIVYRVDPQTMEATEAFRFAEHLGGIVLNIDDRTLHAVSWGSRRFYTWRIDEVLDRSRSEIPPEPAQSPNPAHYVDYQDCQYVGDGEALCTGVSRITGPEHTVALGGMELIDLREGRPLHQVPVPLWTEAGVPMTQNPVAFEISGNGLRAYFLPEDDDGRLFVYDVAY